MDRLKKSLMHLRRNSSKAFTLIELLIVIGILGILAVTVLLTLNPAEAQRKARDLQRAKDAITLQTVMEQALADGIAPTPCGGANCLSSTVTGTQQPCAANWLGVNLCTYAKSIPADPLNGRTAYCYSYNGVTATRTANCNMRYALRTSGGTDYEIDYKIESAANVSKLFNDSGDNIFAVEIFSSANNLYTPVGNQNF